MTVPSIVHLKTSNCQMMFHFVFFCFIYFPLKYLHLGVSTNGGIVGYCWFRVENPSFEMNDNWGYPYISENLHISYIYIYIYIYIYSYIITWVLNPQWSQKMGPSPWSPGRRGAISRCASSRTVWRRRLRQLASLDRSNRSHGQGQQGSGMDKW